MALVSCEQILLIKCLNNAICHKEKRKKKKEKAFSLTIFFQVGPSLFSEAENTLDTKRQVQDRPTKAAEPVALLQIQQRNQPEQYVNRKMTFFHSASKKMEEHFKFSKFEWRCENFGKQKK